MMRILSRVTLPALLAIGTFGQTSDTPPTFEIADVHVSAKTPNAFMRMTPARGTRYELKNATMVDLIRLAYNVDADKVLGGPSWLEMNRYDVIAKLPPDSTPETQKLMLQPLLADRFKLVVHKETKALPTFALTVGKKPQLKEADGTEQTGCRPQGSGAPAEGGVRLMMASPTGAPTTINLGPGMIITYQCRNMTMEAFAGGLRGMMGANVGPNQVLDQTGLKGAWNFDVKWSMSMSFGPMQQQGEHISMSDAFEKQLGLKLEERQIPTPVIVVDSVNEKPSGNPPGVSEALPVVPPPTEFEVADVKPVEPGAPMGGRFQFQPGGRLVAQGMTLRFLIARAFVSTTAGPMMMNNDSIVGVPKFADTDRYDITAKAPSGGPSAPALDMESAAPMMRSLLVERFGMKYHMEERPMPAFALVAAKPKMKKADPNSRTNCKFPNTPAGADAYILLAEAQRKEKKFTEANKTLETFISKYPKHELVSTAKMAMAGNLDSMGKTDEALAMYQQIASAYPNSYTAPLAMLSQVYILKAKNRNDDARRICETVLTQYRTSFWASDAMQQLRLLKPITTSTPPSGAATGPTIPPMLANPPAPAPAPQAPPAPNQPQGVPSPKKP